MIACEPAVRVDVVKVATPALTEAEPMAVAPSMNVIDPPGTSDPVGTGVTVAVRVIDVPYTDGFVLLWRAVVLSALTTVIDTVAGSLVRAAAHRRPSAPQPVGSPASVTVYVRLSGPV